MTNSTPIIDGAVPTKLAWYLRADVAVRDGGFGAGQLDQPPVVVVNHRVVVGDLGPCVDLCIFGIDRDPRPPGVKPAFSVGGVRHAMITHT
jgi:hypothetical protein